MSVKDYFYRYEDRCTTVHWIIPTFDESLSPPLPLRNHFYCLNWCKLSAEEAAYVADKYQLNKICTEDDLPDLDGPAFENAEVREGNAVKDDIDMLPLRDRFDLIDKRTTRLLEDELCGCVGVRLIGDYIEDKDGRRISHHDIATILNGPNVVVMGDFDSLRKSVGVSSPRSESNINSNKSGILAHYLGVIEQIYRSRWYKSRASYTTRGKLFVSVELPTIHDIRSVAILFRQLYDGSKWDNLFANAVEVYFSIVDSDIKRVWVGQERDRFQATLAVPPLGMGIEDSGKDFLEAVGYGYRIFHANPRDKGVKLLKRLIDKYSEERVLFSYDSVLRFLFNHALKAYLVINMDYKSWVESSQCPQHELLDFEHLIGK